MTGCEMWLRKWPTVIQQQQEDTDKRQNVPRCTHRHVVITDAIVLYSRNIGSDYNAVCVRFHRYIQWHNYEYTLAYIIFHWLHPFGESAARAGARIITGAAYYLGKRGICRGRNFQDDISLYTMPITTATKCLNFKLHGYRFSFRLFFLLFV